MDRENWPSTISPASDRFCFLEPDVRSGSHGKQIPEPVDNRVWNGNQSGISDRQRQARYVPNSLQIITVTRLNRTILKLLKAWK